MIVDTISNKEYKIQIKPEQKFQADGVLWKKILSQVQVRNPDPEASH